MTKPAGAATPTRRLISLDVFRGITMFLLMAEATHVYWSLTDAAANNAFLGAIIGQFHHHPWNGLRFWDLIQPYFMFIVGVAMVFSIASRRKRGDSSQVVTIHFLKRSLILFALGVILHCGYNQKLVWELWNVLTQLAFTILIAYLIFNLPIKTQLIISFGILLGYDLLFRFWPMAGYNQAFVIDKNFGTWMDMVLMGKINPGGGWLTINFLSTSAHTIWGVLAGKILMSDKSSMEKIKILAIAGLAGLVIGYGLDWSGVTPIIKRICTSSFVLVSGGWCLLTLVFLYWLVDVKGYSKWTFIFVVVGMNPIFIYMFGQTLGEQWFNGFVGIFTHGILGSLGASEISMRVINSLVVLTLQWYLCYWLYKKKVFVKI